MQIPVTIQGKFLSFLLIFSITASYSLQAQTTKEQKKAAKAAQYKALVDSQNFVFKVQTVLPMSGSARQTTSDWDLKVLPDQLVSYLPYFGRAYQAPIDPSKGGLTFTSKSYDYKPVARTKGGWDIQIKPKDNQDIQNMTLSVSESGYGTLQVTSTNRQPISFTGYIMANNNKSGKKRS